MVMGSRQEDDSHGQTKQHQWLIYMLRMKRICVDANEMDRDTANYKQAQEEEIANKIDNTLKGRWKTDLSEKSTTVLWTYGRGCNNLPKKSAYMDWQVRHGQVVSKETVHSETLFEVLSEVCRIPERRTSASTHMPTNCVDSGQAAIKPGMEVKPMPTHTSSNPTLVTSSPAWTRTTCRLATTR